MAEPARWGRRERPLVIAHRGASADAVENTLAAFRRARQDGADGVELDVMRCATGEVVVFHDDDLERLAKRPGLVRATPFGALREIDLGGGERIPLLDEVLEELGPLLVNVELKSQSRLRDDGLASSVAGILRRHAARARTLVSSFDPLLLARFRLRAPDLATGLLFAHDQSLPLRRALAAPLLRPTALHPEAALVDAERVRAWHARGYALNVWTVDEAAELRLLAALGVDGVITNRPKYARSVLQS
ncbi:MAG TPA: glycerophosphodiester phosphodiesterase [Polyangia bacterium]